jgi:hypothetical protein
MRVLLDECLPARLRFELPGHDVTTVPHRGWSGIKNGALLRRAVDDGFDAFITADKKLPDQHRMVDFDIAVFVLRSRSNDLEPLRRLMPELRSRLSSASRRSVTILGEAE